MQSLGLDNKVALESIDTIKSKSIITKFKEKSRCNEQTKQDED